jgi:diguanylate cyclase
MRRLGSVENGKDSRRGLCGRTVLPRARARAGRSTGFVYDRPVAGGRMDGADQPGRVGQGADAGREPGGRLHRTVYPFRILGMGLSVLPVGTVLAQLQAPPAYWAIMVFGALLWPHLAWWRTRGRADAARLERQNLLVDSALAGVMLPLMHFNLLPSALLATLATVDKINTGIRGMWLRALPFMLGGVLAGSIATGFAWQPVTDMAVIVACMPLLVIHTVAVSLNGYRLVRRVHSQNVRLDELSRTDPLTGLDNRRTWEEHASRLLERQLAGGASATLVMVDIDGFKSVNDARGHAVGDDVLRAVAAVLQDCIGPGERAARYGGDEFALVLADTEAGALATAERIREHVRALRFEADPALRCSVSLGVAGADPRHPSLRRWMVAADAALYRAKRSGRDRACTPADIADPAPPG